MKLKIVVLMVMFSFLGNAQTKDIKESIYDIQINNINGESIDFEAYKGNKILLVNVASKCGYTGQYKDLQSLYNTYQDNLMIIGVPCNQFGGQEPGTADEIESFCKLNYGVSFLITEKIEVKGKNQHPLYKWLTKKEENGVKDSSVKWNFQKYLIDENGVLIDSFNSNVSPLSEEITNYL